MVFSYGAGLIARWWEEEEEDDSDDDDFIIAAMILGMEHERTKAKHRGSVSGHQVVMRDMPSGDSHILTNKRPRTDNSTPSPEKVGQEDGSSRSQTLDSSQPSQKERPARRKQAKDKMRSGGESGPYMEALQELLAVAVKDKEKERKLMEEIWKMIKSFQERKLALEEEKLALVKRKLMWEKEYWIMFCDVSTMEPEKKAKVLAMRAQIASEKMAIFNKSSDGASSSVFGGGSGGHHDGS